MLCTKNSPSFWRQVLFIFGPLVQRIADAETVQTPNMASSPRFPLSHWTDKFELPFLICIHNRVIHL